jgi:hypothetical protein
LVKSSSTSPAAGQAVGAARTAVESLRRVEQAGAVVEQDADWVRQVGVGGDQVEMAVPVKVAGLQRDRLAAWDREEQRGRVRCLELVPDIER